MIQVIFLFSCSHYTNMSSVKTGLWQFPVCPTPCFCPLECGTSVFLWGGCPVVGLRIWGKALFVHFVQCVDWKERQCVSLLQKALFSTWFFLKYLGECLNEDLEKVLNYYAHETQEWVFGFHQEKRSLQEKRKWWTFLNTFRKHWAHNLRLTYCNDNFWIPKFK